jgi:hypothetical protein
MATFRDLDPLTYFGPVPELIAVGWLGPDAEYTRGRVSPQFLDRLKDLVAYLYDPTRMLGVHLCEFCPADDAPPRGLVLFVPDDDKLLVCPALIVHYIEEHEYEPPVAFQDAVMRCPRPDTREYWDVVQSIKPGMLGKKWREYRKYWKRNRSVSETKRKRMS